MPRTTNRILHALGFGGQPKTPPEEEPDDYDSFGVNVDMAAHSRKIVLRLQGFLWRQVAADKADHASCDVAKQRDARATRSRAKQCSAWHSGEDAAWHASAPRLFGDV